MQIIGLLIIVLLEVLYHLRPDIIQKALEALPQLFTMLQEGGKIFIRLLSP